MKLHCLPLVTASVSSLSFNVTFSGIGRFMFCIAVRAKAEICMGTSVYWHIRDDHLGCDNQDICLIM